MVLRQSWRTPTQWILRCAQDDGPRRMIVLFAPTRRSAVTTLPGFCLPRPCLTIRLLSPHPMKRLPLLFFILTLLSSLAGAASLPETTLINAPARVAQSLNGRWNIIIDPYDAGYFNYRLQPHD